MLQNEKTDTGEVYGVRLLWHQNDVSANIGDYRYNKELLSQLGE